MLIIRGVNVFPSQIESALLEMGGTTPHYLLIVDRVNNLDTLEVQVEVEERFFSDEIRELENLTGKIAYMIQQAIGCLLYTSLWTMMREDILLPDICWNWAIPGLDAWAAQRTWLIPTGGPRAIYGR